MKDNNQLLDKFKDYEDRALAKELLGYASVCASGYVMKNTDFLDPRQRKIAEDILSCQRGIRYGFYGGIEESERAVCIVCNEDLEITEEDVPVKVLLITWNKLSRKLSHRDLLGGILGCGIKREKIGDIILDEYKAYAACMPDISRYLLYNLSKVGSTAVNVTEAVEVQKKEEKVRTITSTVASLRLDSLVATGCGISRAKAAEAVKSGRIRVNWEDVSNPSREIKQGDVISVRGKGRIVLEEVSGTTKKDRIKLTLKKYL